MQWPLFSLNRFLPLVCHERSCVPSRLHARQPAAREAECDARKSRQYNGGPCSSKLAAHGNAAENAAIVSGGCLHLIGAKQADRAGPAARRAADMPTIAGSLEEALALVADGSTLLVPRGDAGVAMEATRALIRRGVRRVSLVAVPTSGLQADLLVGAGWRASTEAAGGGPGAVAAPPPFAAAGAAGGAVHVGPGGPRG